MDVIREHKTTYSSGNIELINSCDGTNNPFEFATSNRYPSPGHWVDIAVLKDMKRVITRALHDAAKEGAHEYVEIAEED